VAVVNRHRVVAVSKMAAAQGVTVGLRPREAQARCPTLVVDDDDPHRNAHRFEPVVQAVGSLVPLVEVIEPGSLVFAARGPARYVGGETALADRVLSLVCRVLGPRTDVISGVGVGIAGSRFAAGVAARRSVPRGSPIIIDEDETAAFLASVALGSLSEVGGIEPELVARWHRLGLVQLRDLAALSMSDVVARFGVEGARAHRLARGLDEEPVNAAPPPPELTMYQAFDQPVVSVAPLVFVGKHLADQMCARLGDRGEICVRLLVDAETEHGETTQRVWYRPTGLSAGGMVDRIRWQLEGWAGDLTGGVTLLRLTPVEVRAHHGHQPGLWGGRSEADEWAARTVARLSGLLGPDAVTVPVWRGGRRTRDQYDLVPAALTDPDERSSQVRPRPDPWPGRIPAPSPTEVLESPLPAIVSGANGNPVQVSGRGLVSEPPVAVSVTGGATDVIVAWAGPWPVEEHWWDPRRRRRQARFHLLTESGIGLTAAVEGGRWWIEGRYS
jgi:protein ImuB